MDNRIIVFLTILGAIFVAIGIGVSIGSSELMVPGVTLITLGTVGLIAVPEVSAFLAVALFASGLTAPYLPGQFGLYYVALTAVAGFAFLFIVFRRASVFGMTPSHWLLLGFCAVVLFTGLKRGMGFQFLGSNLWGGFFYIQILMSGLLVFTLPRVNMPASWWPRAILIMGLLAPLPLLADLLVVHGVGFGIVRMFMQTGATVGTLLSEQESGGGLGRLTSAGIAAQSMIIAFLAVIHTGKLFRARSIWAVFLLTVIVVLSLLSGFRMMTAMLFAIVFVTALLQGTLTIPRVVTGIILSIIGLLILYKISDELPYNVQRSISWLPGIDVSRASAEDAAGTITWRLDLWHEALRFIPEYFWIGKGFSYDANQFLSARTGYASYDALNWAFVTGAYHNGYLSLLLLTGIFGFLTGLPLLVLATIRHVRLTRSEWLDPRLHQCHQAVIAAQICWALIYLSIYGDVTAVFPSFFFNWAVLEAIRHSDEKLSATGTLVPLEAKEDYAFID
ncbi:MAG: O-antigen ligase family protein [Terrimicrobiaceae bacterium]|nr:O-antigen ligase family protein [Terrimicrobiaceae bacterium]